MPNRLVIDTLKKDYFDTYLKSFSPVIQTILGVHSLESERSYLEHQLWAQMHNITYFYCLFDVMTSTCIGAIEIRNKIQFPGQLYCWLTHSYWGKGYLQEGMSLVTGDYFSKSKETSFTAHVHKDNLRSYYALLKCGFIDGGFYNGPWGLQYRLQYNAGVT